MKNSYIPLISKYCSKDYNLERILYLYTYITTNIKYSNIRLNTDYFISLNSNLKSESQLETKSETKSETKLEIDQQSFSESIAQNITFIDHLDITFKNYTETIKNTIY
jgi:hypothetical protein